MYLVCSLAALLAGLVQGIAGFGSGPVQMMAYPLYWTIPTAAAVSVCVSVPLNLNMTLTYLKEIRWKKVLVPILPYMAVCSLAISFSLNVDQTLIKRIFGVFLIALSVYYLCFSRREKKPLGPWQTAAYILISALCDAFFGIGGPLMVIYFLNKTDSAKEYLGTAAAFFLINGVYNTVYRLLSGILTKALLPYIGVGIAAILAGVTLAHFLARKLNDAVIKKAVYVMIGVTGIFNLFA
ncbi:MAG: sulfite exporter TauE/SafE family protein [Clostridia bacterium]|nr:sulfite exporter TauE/SafE family protein [Clostridia bacterium]